MDVANTLTVKHIISVSVSLLFIFSHFSLFVDFITAWMEDYLKGGFGGYWKMVERGRCGEDL